jgi:hypothetical protein
MDKPWAAALTGGGFVVLGVASFAVGGEPPDVDEPITEAIDFYDDDIRYLGAALGALAGTVLVFFGGILRRVLRDAEGPNGVLSAVAFAGTIILATGAAIDATITFALTEAAEDLEPAAVQSLLALWHNDFMPFAVGGQIFLLATGLSIVRHGALPKWLGWIAIVLAIIGVTPIGFAAFVGMVLLVAIFGVLIWLRGRSGAGGDAAAPNPGPGPPSSASA